MESVDFAATVGQVMAEMAPRPRWPDELAPGRHAEGLVAHEAPSEIVAPVATGGDDQVDTDRKQDPIGHPRVSFGLLCVALVAVLPTTDQPLPPDTALERAAGLS